VLTAFDDQRVYSTDQFVKLVRAERPGQEVSLQFLREGKLQNVRLALGKLNPSDVRAWTPSAQAQPFRFGRPDRVLRRFSGQPIQALEWGNFDSLVVKRLGLTSFASSCSCGTTTESCIHMSSLDLEKQFIQRLSRTRN